MFSKSNIFILLIICFMYLMVKSQSIATPTELGDSPPRDDIAPQGDSSQVESAKVNTPPQGDYSQAKSPHLNSLQAKSLQLNSLQAKSPHLNSLQAKSSLQLNSLQAKSLQLNSPQANSPQIDSSLQDAPQIDSLKITINQQNVSIQSASLPIPIHPLQNYSLYFLVPDTQESYELWQQFANRSRVKFSQSNSPVQVTNPQNSSNYTMIHMWFIDATRMDTLEKNNDDYQFGIWIESSQNVSAKTSRYVFEYKCESHQEERKPTVFWRIVNRNFKVYALCRDPDEHSVVETSWFQWTIFAILLLILIVILCVLGCLTGVVCCGLYLCYRRVTRWFSGVGKKKNRNEEYHPSTIKSYDRLIKAGRRL